MRENSLIKQNIIKYLDYKGITKYEFYKNTGVSNGVLSQKSGMSEENTLRFISHYKDVSTKWLLTGTGEMLIDEKKEDNPTELRDQGEFSEKIDIAAKEIEFWKMKYLDTNEKYTALLESQLINKKNNNDKRNTG